MGGVQGGGEGKGAPARSPALARPGKELGIDGRLLPHCAGNDEPFLHVLEQDHVPRVLQAGAAARPAILPVTGSSWSGERTHARASRLWLCHADCKPVFDFQANSPALRLAVRGASCPGRKQKRAAVASESFPRGNPLGTASADCPHGRVKAPLDTMSGANILFRHWRGVINGDRQITAHGNAQSLTAMPK